MKIIAFTSYFPNQRTPYSGQYLYKILTKLSEFNKLTLINPISLTPPLYFAKKPIQNFNKMYIMFKELYRLPNFVRQGRMDIHHPKLIYAPKELGLWSHGVILFCRLMPLLVKLLFKSRPDIFYVNNYFPDGIPFASDEMRNKE